MRTKLRLCTALKGDARKRTKSRIITSSINKEIEIFSEDIYEPRMFSQLSAQVGIFATKTYINCPITNKSCS